MTSTSNNLIEMTESDFTVAMTDESEITLRAAFSARTETQLIPGDRRGGVVAIFDLDKIEGYSAHNQGIVI